MPQVQTEIEWLHSQACGRGDPTYVDPDTGDRVFTAIYLKKRGSCCDMKCRHCPYEKVSMSDIWEE